MTKSVLVFLLIFCGSVVVICQTATYFLDSFQYTMTHDGENPENYFPTRLKYVGVGFGVIIVGLFLKYFKRKTS